MATYQKRGQKRSSKAQIDQNSNDKSATAEVFETLDSTAGRTETIVARYQNHILIIVGSIVLITLSYLGYDKFILEPRNSEAVSELNKAQYYFEIALNSSNSDSLYQRALNGGEGRYGFLDIIENYPGTSASKLATYSAGMSYLNIKDYENAIKYLDKFDSDDIMLSALAKGAIGDAFAQLGQNQEAYEYYVKAFNASSNSYSTPKYLYKAGMLGSELGKKSSSIEFFKRIKQEFPGVSEAQLVDVQIGRLENIK
jgi:tetratricopeptide (TPR) repeat protein